MKGEPMTDDRRETAQPALAFLAKQLRIHGYKALPCQVCRREGSIGIHALNEALQQILEASAAPAVSEPSAQERRMGPEQLAVLADDIADMAGDFIQARDVTSLRNTATNLAGMIRIHVPALAASPAPVSEPRCANCGAPAADHPNRGYVAGRIDGKLECLQFAQPTAPVREPPSCLICGEQVPLQTIHEPSGVGVCNRCAQIARAEHRLSDEYPMVLLRWDGEAPCVVMTRVEFERLDKRPAAPVSEPPREQELEAALEQEIAIRDALFALINGQEVSDFMLSFAIVRQAEDELLRREVRPSAAPVSEEIAKLLRGELRYYVRHLAGCPLQDMNLETAARYRARQVEVDDCRCGLDACLSALQNTK